MASSGIQSSTSISSNRKRKAEVPAMIQSRRAKFFETYLPQDFSLPDSIIYYIAKNPTSPELYEKMVQTCKEFFVKNPVLVIPEFYHCGDGKWKLPSVNRPINLSKIASNFWITNRFNVQTYANKVAFNRNIISSLLPKIYKCDAKTVTIWNLTISFPDLTRFISYAEDISFYNVIVKDVSGSNVAVEKIIEAAVKAKNIKISSDITQSNITSETMKELIKLPHFLKLDHFYLHRIPEAFDLVTFYSYMKKNKITKIFLEFDDSNSEAYNNHLQAIADEILETETHGYKPPYIGFSELDREKKDRLFGISFSPISLSVISCSL